MSLGPITGGGSGANELTADELAAIQGANAPSAGNVFATIADIPAPSSPGVTGPNESVVGNLAVWANTTGDEIADAGRGPGKLIQQVWTPKTDTATVTGTSFGSVFSAAITTQVANTKISARVNLSVGSAANQIAYIRVVRGGVVLFQGDAAGNRQRISTASFPGSASAMAGCSFEFEDSPAAAENTLLTYEIEIASHTTGAVYINRSGTDSDTSAFARGASSITLSEIAI